MIHIHIPNIIKTVYIYIRQKVLVLFIMSFIPLPRPPFSTNKIYIDSKGPQGRVTMG